nr:MAG TPA: hypothetical protein [Caudoviricetes sp.]
MFFLTLLYHNVFVVSIPFRCYFLLFRCYLV